MTREQLLAALAGNLPAIIGAIRPLLAGHAGAENLTDAELVAGLNDALASELAKGADWLAKHPKK